MIFGTETTRVDGDYHNVEQRGVGNTLVNITVNSQFDNPEIVNEIIRQLAGEVSSGVYNVFICAPSANEQNDVANKIYKDLTDSLRGKELDFIVGGGREYVAGDGPYPHVNESEILKGEKCNAMVIIADDYSTFSQLSLLSHVGHAINKLSIDMYAICKDEVIENEEFIRLGPISFFEDVLRGRVIKFSECDTDKVHEVVDKISKKKLFWSTQRGSKRG